MRKSSLEAHEAIKPVKDTHYHIIKNTMIKIGKPSTGKTIAKHCKNLTYHAIMRRLSEMRDMSMILESGRDNTQKFNPILWSVN